jgi:hypothetical protein
MDCGAATASWRQRRDLVLDANGVLVDANSCDSELMPSGHGVKDSIHLPHVSVLQRHARFARPYISSSSIDSAKTGGSRTTETGR